jgi:hypothetical protein
MPSVLLPLSLRCERVSWHGGATASTWVGHDEEARAALDTTVQRRRRPRSRANKRGRASMSGSLADMDPSPSHVGVASVPRRANVVVGLLPPLNSTLRWASILPRSMEMLPSSVLDVSEVCCKCFIWMLQKSIGMLHMLQVFQLNVASLYSKCFVSVSDVCLQVFWSGCCICFTYVARVCSKCSVLYCSKCFHVASCKYLFRSCIYCNGYTRMLQVYVSNVLVVFRSMLQLFYLDVTYAAVAIHICCKVCF